MGGKRPKGMDLERPHRQLDIRTLPNSARSPETQGNFISTSSHEPGWGGVQTHHQHQQPTRLQRSLLFRRQNP